MDVRGDITQLLLRARQGDAEALNRLTPLVYEHLHQLAAILVSRERAGHTLQPTALLNEAFLRLMEGSKPEWDSRVHFYAIAARVMRQVLIDHARRRMTRKRSADGAVFTLVAADRSQELIPLDQALTKLAAIDPRKAEVLELRYFGGLSVEEICSALGVSISTVRRESRLAEAWLQRELAGGRRT